jgi:hypothetical protein
MSEYFDRTKEINAAMCAWEAMLNTENYFDRSHEQFSLSSCRWFVNAIAPHINEGWELANDGGEGFTDPFDEKFCPWFIDRCINHESRNLTLSPGWKQSCIDLGVAAAKCRPFVRKAWMLVIEEPHHNSVWVFETADAFDEAIDICTSNDLRCFDILLFGENYIAAALILSGGMNTAEEVANKFNDEE